MFRFCFYFCLEDLIRLRALETLFLYQFEHFNFILATRPQGASSQHLDPIVQLKMILAVDESHFGTPSGYFYLTPTVEIGTTQNTCPR
jgi:hypothetical protein